MNKCLKYFLLLLVLSGLFRVAQAQTKATTFSSLEKDFLHPPAEAKPWVFWYWMQAAVSKEGITADLESMKAIGLGGAYLMPIKDTATPALYKPATRQLSPEWWDKLRFAMQEAQRLGLQLAMHVSDGFALAGGPWIKPEMSMQKLVWSQLHVKGGAQTNLSLPQPETNEGYYKDIAVYAYPEPQSRWITTSTVHPVITTSKPGVAADFLIKTNSRESFKSDSACWIQYAFAQPFTCRSIIIRTNGNNYQSHRLIVEASDDGIHFHLVKRLQPPRHGWQDTDADVTHSIPSTTAKYFRFTYDKKGSEPGSEDLDAAKWKPALKIAGIELSTQPLINQYEGKNGEVWRVGKRSTAEDLPDSLCIPAKQLINITTYCINGKLNWNAPNGNWTIIRIGHTSTGHRNETAGEGRGLECDKFNVVAVKTQFDNWFGKTFDVLGEDAKKVLKLFHVDSWECGSQNWSSVFPAEFKKRRGYDLLPYLPVMTGIPVNNAAFSEKVLYDVRQTIAELVNDVFFETLAKLSKEKGCLFSAESVAPTMLSDGMLHYSKVDYPMGEFWLKSPTHDKPNDMLDAISGGHIYGKQIIQSESFTTLRMSWDEHPGMLKPVGDRNLALGINRLVFHVFTHNPWMDRKPGMTLDGIGLYFQRNQTWFQQSKAWMEYIQRCQALLQKGQPVVDIAVFTGEELPRRSLLPDRLVPTLPGIFGKDRVAAEAKRLANSGEPLRTIPDGVVHSANMADPENWVNPLNGYAYDSFNPDALLRLATVKDERIVFGEGTSYALLVFPAAHPMMPDNIMSTAVAEKIIQLVKDGATILMDIASIKNADARKLLATLQQQKQTLGSKTSERLTVWKYGKGRLIQTPYESASFVALNIDRDIETNASKVAYTHRKTEEGDLYFIANQQNQARELDVSFRVINGYPEIWNPVTGEIQPAKEWGQTKNRTAVHLQLAANESVFVVFRSPSNFNYANAWKKITSFGASITRHWEVLFDQRYGGPKEEVHFDSLTDWSKHNDARIKYYSGTAIYRNTFTVTNRIQKEKCWLNIGEVNNIASVKVNGVDCGTIWTAPFRIDISKAIKTGDNTLEIQVTNTWANRLIGDHALPEKERITHTIAPYRLEGKPLLKAGLMGSVRIEWQ